MIWLSLLLAQGPAQPPAEWTQVHRDTQTGGLIAPLSLGSGRPFSEPQSTAQSALVSGEAMLTGLQALVDPAAQGADFETQLAVARSALELSDKIVQELAPCQSERALQGPCRARAADALRLAVGAISAIPVPVGLDPAEQAYFNNMAGLMAEIRGPLVVQAKDSYQRVVDDPTVAPEWRAHARWGLTQLPEQK